MCDRYGDYCSDYGDINNSPLSDKENEIEEAYMEIFCPPNSVSESEGENLYEKNHEQNLEINKQQNIEFANNITLDNNPDKKTKPTTITAPFKELNKNLINQAIKEYNIDVNQTKYIGQKRGRKSKKKKLEGEASHTKKEEDNIMRKIKTHLIEFIIYLLTDSLIDKTMSFYKLDKTISENLKKDYNMKLMQRTLLDLFLKEKVNLRNKKNPNGNIDLINKILEEKNEIKTIELLNLTFIQMVNLIQKNYLDEYLETIRKKENDNNNEEENLNLDEYMNTLKNLFLGYEDWFKNKTGRNRGDKDKAKKIKIIHE